MIDDILYGIIRPCDMLDGHSYKVVHSMYNQDIGFSMYIQDGIAYSVKNKDLSYPIDDSIWDKCKILVEEI